MGEFRIVIGEGKTEISLWATTLGTDLIVHIYNQNAHIGAVAVGEYDQEHERASVSVHTRLGHKDDAVAQKAAYSIARSTRKPVCVITGIHVDNITPGEITRIIENARKAVETFLHSMESPS
jgi:gallate decarboxylase subunit D